MAQLESLSAPPVPISALTRDFLSWLAASPRTYGEAMAAWRTSCPRLTIWEDALAEGFIRVAHGTGRSMDQAPVLLTPRGRAVLEGV